MKKIIFILLLVIPFAINAQDLTIDKGSGWLYFSGVPGTTPNEACCAEVAINLLTREAYIWNRDSSAWERWYAISQGVSVPSGSPGSGPALYLNRLSGQLYQWSGSAWVSVGNNTDLSVIGDSLQISDSGGTFGEALADINVNWTEEIFNSFSGDTISPAGALPNISGQIILIRNGLIQVPGASYDYTISANQIILTKSASVERFRLLYRAD